MFRFYVQKIENGIAFLDEIESRHCSKVLRKKINETIHLVDGVGGFHEAEIIEISKSEVKAKISISEKVDARPYRIHVVVAPTKMNSRLEWLYEKLTEVGVDEITPIICQRSERKKLRIDRLEKIVLSAMKQSLKAYLPKVNPPITFDLFVSSKLDVTHKYVAHCLDKDKQNILDDYKRNEDCIILIGPEGDFTIDEIEKAINNGFLPLDLGKSRLRTETAALVACQSINFVNRW